MMDKFDTYMARSLEEEDDMRKKRKIQEELRQEDDRPGEGRRIEGGPN